MTPVRAALIVQNCVAGRFSDNITSSLKLISSAVKQDAQFIVFPEMNLTGYTTGPKIISISRPVDDRIVQPFSDKARESNTTILVGLAEQSPDNKIHAAHLCFYPTGSFDIYRKIHTAPFEKNKFTPGNTIRVFNSNGLTFGIQLCYDAHFPELSLAMALKKADVIFMPHASPRGSSQEKYDSWIRHLRARAFDNGIYIAACNQTGSNTCGLTFPGISVFIGPDGNVIYKSTDDMEGIHMVTIDKSALDRVRSHKMKYFLPNRRSDLFDL